jgi:hypothetical protein
MAESRFWPWTPTSKEVQPEYIAYTFWLLSSLTSEEGDNTYYFLAIVLNSIEFYYTMPEDENRALDGINLRKSYSNNTEDDIFEIMSCGCTALELLVALSMHMNNITYYPGDNESAWFWIMLENLDIRISDKDWPKQDSLDIIKSNLSRWFDRKFTKKGKGSPFPMKKCQEDLRHVNMWDHMQWYIGEILEGV